MTDQPTLESTQSHPSISDSVWKEIHSLAGPAVHDAVHQIETKAIKTFSQNTDTLFGIIHYLPDGTFSAKQIVGDAERLTGRSLDNKTLDFIASFDKISKHGDHIELKRSKDATFPIANEVPGTGGLISNGKLNIGKDMSFDLSQDKHGHNEIANLRGLSVGLDAAGQSVSADITKVVIHKDAHGHNVFTASVDNPTPGLGQFLLRQPGEISADLQFNSEGKPRLINGKGIRQQVIGGNPLVDGAASTISDTGKAINDPSLGNFGQVAVDVGNEAVVAPIQTAASFAGDAVDSINPFN